MKVALNVSPLNTGHQIRGIGTYTDNLLAALKNLPSEIDLETFSNSAPRNVDIVHYPFFDLFFHTLPLRKHVRRVVTIHDIIPLIFPEHYPKGIRGTINLFLQKVALKNTDFVICDSQASKDDVIRKLRFPENRIDVVYLAVDKIFKKTLAYNQQKIAEKYALPKDFMLYVGDVNWNKNLDILLEAVKIRRVPLVIVGSAIKNENLAETKYLNKLIYDLEINDLITKTGFVPKEDLVEIYNLATVTVFPSFYEGFGLPVLESMACGTPVVCSKNSSLVEIAEDLPIYCNPGSSTDIANKVSQVYSFNALGRKSVSQKLINHASEFTWQKTAKETLRIYKKVLKLSGV